VRKIFDGVSFIACPCTGVSNKNAVNINADNVAVALAEGVHARKLIFLSDVDGVMRNGKLLSMITDQDIPELIKSGVAEGGMKVKLENCLHALQSGVKRIHLINGSKPNALANEIYDAQGNGTMILRDDDRESYLNEIETQEVIERKMG
jgi:acetylglutamate kinase